MSIVLNELAWAERAIKEKDLGKKPYETLGRVAKYYTYQGMTKRNVRKKMDEFLLSCDPAISIVAWSNTLDSAVKYASKHPLVVLDGVNIMKSEMEKIDALGGTQVRRLAFTLLCIAKYYYAVTPKTAYWVVTPDPEIMGMANINTSIKRQSAMYAQLKDAGLIRFSRKIDNLSIQVLFADEEDDTVLHVSDFRNLGYQYMMYHGGPYFICENCGIATKKVDHGGGRGRPNKYCPDCSVKLRMKCRVESVMKSRAK